MWDMHDGWGWWMIIGWIWMIVLWGLIIWAVYAVVSRLDQESRRSQGSNAQAIREERFARGKITREEFEGACGILAGEHRRPPTRT